MDDPLGWLFAFLPQRVQLLLVGLMGIIGLGIVAVIVLARA